MVLALIIILFLILLFHRNILWDNAAKTFSALLSGLLLYEFSLVIDEIAKEKTVKENTKYIYELYKIELETNIGHINKYTKERWIPFYRLQTSTRDNLWGEMADYSKDINLMKKINALYNEFVLINNKIDIMNAVRLQLTIRPYEEMSGVVIPEDITKLKDELNSQLNGCIGLGAGAIKIAEECLQIISEQTKKLKI
jgi:hypothetical protein